MADPLDRLDRRRRARAVWPAQLLLVMAAAALWAASRLPWVTVRSFDGLGQPRQFAVSGAAWSTGLLPLALLSLAAAIAAVAVRGRPLRALSVLTAAASLAAGYLAVSVWAVADTGNIAARAAEIADVPIASLVGSERHYTGAAFTCAAAVCILAGAVLLMRSASGGRGDGALSATRYVTPAARRSKSRLDLAGPQVPDMSERMIWDALDEGCDPTQDPTENPGGTSAGPDPEGR